MPPTFGEGKNSWLTGTAAWSFVSVSQAILGVKPDYDGLRLEPCVPENMKQFSISRRFRGATYRIRVENPDGVQRGVKCIRVNGARIDGSLVPALPAGGTAEIVVEMG